MDKFFKIINAYFLGDIISFNYLDFNLKFLKLEF